MFIQYAAPLDNSDLSDERAWDYFRGYRNRLLSESDWTQVADAPVNQAAWVRYRQALRDLPEKTADPRKAVWPESPTD
jgi:hypothetical protein